MAIMAMDTKVNKLVVILSSCCLTFTSLAGDWQLKSSVNLDETYSDNIELSQTDKTSGLVTQAGVSLGADYKAQNASLAFNSTSTQAWYSHNHELDQAYNSINTNGRLLLWPNGLTLTGSASLGNQARNSSQNALASIISADLVQTERYQVGLEYNIDNSRYLLNSRANYQMSESEDRLGENKGSSFSFSSMNGSAAKNIFWEASGNYSERKNNNRDSNQYVAEIKVGLITNYHFLPFIRYYDEDNAGKTNRRNNLETNSYGVGFRWQPIPRLLLDVSYNQPIGTSVDTNNEEQKAYLDVELNWQPTSRTHIQAGRSQRFYGDSYSFSLTHKNRRLSNSINYQEQAQSFTRDNYVEVSSDFVCANADIFDNINNLDLSNCSLLTGDTFDPNEFSIITISGLELVEDNDYWLNKTLGWSSVLTLPRTSFTLSLNHSDRENLNSGSSNTTKSASLGANRKLSPSSTLGIQASYNERGYGQSALNQNGQNDKYRRYGINFNKSLNQALNFTLDLDRIDRTSNQARYNYSENRLSLRLSKDF